MIEILEYVTSGFWVFIGCTMFITSMVTSIGWAINAMLVGIRGKEC